jgi:hypothetical protein
MLIDYCGDMRVMSKIAGRLARPEKPLHEYGMRGPSRSNVKDGDWHNESRSSRALSMSVGGSKTRG